MRGDQPARQWKIIRFLVNSKNGKTVAEIIEHIKPDCHHRTIYRDLEVLQMAGFPIFSYLTGFSINEKKWEVLKEGFFDDREEL